MKIQINETTFKNHCDFIKANTTHKTNTSIVKDALRHYYLKVREDRKEQLRNELKELEK